MTAIPFYFAFLHDLSAADLASLFPNETVGLVRARNAGCCTGGTKHFARVMGYRRPPTLAELAEDYGGGTYWARTRKNYIINCLAYVVALRLGRHKFVKQQFMAWKHGETTNDALEENLLHYVLTLLAARRAGRQGI